MNVGVTSNVDWNRYVPEGGNSRGSCGRGGSNRENSVPPSVALGLGDGKEVGVRGAKWWSRSLR